MKKSSTRTTLDQKSVPVAASSTKTTSSPKKISFKQTVSLLLLLGVVLFGASGYYEYKYVLTNPDRIISDVLNKSLQSSSVYRTTTTAKTNQSSATSKEDTYTSFSPQVISKSVAELRENSSIGDTRVITETLGTKDTDYVRYKSIDIKGSTVKRDFSKVLNVWSKRTANPQTGEDTSFLNNALFVVVPFGNLNSDQRHQLKDKIDSLHLYDAKATKKEFQNGRPVMKYSIALDPQKLVQVLSKYVELTGVGDRSQLDPAQYQGAQKIQVEMTVDILSRHLKTVNFVESGRTEMYHGYNVDSSIEIPKQSIGTDELQTRLQTLEKQQ